MKNKILTIENLKKILDKKRKKGKKIVLCHGVFDLLHIGHIKHFNEAKKFGDILVVTLTPDIYVNKGPARPAFNEKLRMQAVAALSMVDYVSLNTNPNATSIIRKIKPNFYCKGPDYKDHKKDISGKIKEEAQITKKFGGRVIYTESETFSSSKLINSYYNFNSSKEKLFIKKIKQNHSFSKIKELIENFKKLKVLIIGETIIDQYVFCEALGKSGKEPVLVLKDLNTEEYLGGAAALSRHVSSFCNKVALLSMIGEKAEYLSKIKQKLPKNVTYKFIKKKKFSNNFKKTFHRSY